MQSLSSRKLVGPALAGLALLLILTMLWISPNATGAFQSPLPVPTGPCFTHTADRFTLDVWGYVTNDDGTTTITYRVTNDNKKDISYAAFGLGDWTPVAPADGATVNGKLGDYHVEWTNDRGNPGFASVKYETEFDGFSQGAGDYFVVTVSGFDAGDSVAVQLKAGNARTTFDVIFDGAACDKTPPPFSPLPTPTATPQGGVVLPSEPVVPECVFSPPPGGIPDEPMIPLDAYSFSEPRVVMTNTAPIWIQQWLPDNKTLMVSQGTDHSNPVVLVDTGTGETVMPTGSLDHSTRMAKWLREDQTTIWLKLAHSENLSGYWVHSLSPPGSRRLSQSSNYGGDFSLDVSPDGKEAVFMSLPGGTQPLIWNQETQELRALPVDLANWRHIDSHYSYYMRAFNAHWQPGGDKILFEDGTWVFLYDLTTDTGCEINMETFNRMTQYVFKVQWSPNGRYLLTQLLSSPPYTTTWGPHDLVLILDTYTGDAVQYSLGNAIYDLIWTSDSQVVTVAGSTNQEIQGFPAMGYYLLNTRNGDYQRILPDIQSLIGIGRLIAWSEDGAQLAFRCQESLPEDHLSGAYVDYICRSQIMADQ